MNSRNLLVASLGLALLGWLSGGQPASAQGTAFTYQGRLTYQGYSANGTYDMTFGLFDALSGGNQIGSTITSSALVVSNGLFTVTLDYGAGAFPGADRWLELGVRTNGSGGDFITLSPRQQLTSAPYAVTAAGFTGTLQDAQLSANIPRLNANQSFTGQNTFANPASSYAGSGGGLTNLNASNLASGTVADARLSANVAKLDTNQTFSGANAFSGVAALTNANNTLTGTHSGSGAGLTSLNAGNISSGTLDVARIGDGTITAGKLAAGVGLPAGVMLPYGGATAPTGWLLCDGSAVSRTTYAGLYAAIGTSYGTGDGSTTFNLPDLRGRVAMGAGTGAGGGASGNGKPTGGSALTARTVGDWAGEEKHLLSVAEMPSHAHGTKAGDGFAAAGSAFHAALAYNAGCNNDTCPTVGAGGDTPHNILQPFTVANYIIKQ